MVCVIDRDEQCFGTCSECAVSRQSGKDEGILRTSKCCEMCGITFYVGDTCYDIGSWYICADCVNASEITLSEEE